MYSKQEISRLKQEFWTRFGQYMKPVPAAGGERINWSNYKTGVPHIYFRMRAERDFASIVIELTDPVTELRLEKYARLESMREMLQQAMGEQWSWESTVVDENHKAISRVGTILHRVNVCDEDSWPEIISFLKPRIIALDTFWDLVREMFG